jgi:hypothetical protein
MQSKLLAKVEELTLHMIQADERNNRLEQPNQELRDRMARLEKSAAALAAQCTNPTPVLAPCALRRGDGLAPENLVPMRTPSDTNISLFFIENKPFPPTTPFPRSTMKPA